MKYWKIGLLGITMGMLAQAGDLYPFTEESQATRFHTLTQELRCMVCHNQSLAESNAPFALTVKQQIYDAILQGQSDSEITTALVAHYGDSLLFDPPWTPRYYVLWVMPLLLVLCAGWVWCRQSSKVATS